MSLDQLPEDRRTSAVLMINMIMMQLVEPNGPVVQEELKKFVMGKPCWTGNQGSLTGEHILVCEDDGDAGQSSVEVRIVPQYTPD